MFLVCYSVISELQEELSIDGPFFHCVAESESDSEIHAKNLTNTKTKDAIIPRVFRMEDGELIGSIMRKARDHWFKKWKDRTLDTSKTMKRDFDNALCPFDEVNLDKIVKEFI